jgi:predicted transcriptional regulator YdeE
MLHRHNRRHKVEIQNVHRETLPALKLVGKKYTNTDRVNGGYGAHWHTWFENDWFEQLEALPQPTGAAESGFLGFMRCNGNDEDFEYWIGLFVSSKSPVPEGFAALDLPAGEVGVCWLHGREKDGIFSQHNRCEEELEKQGWEFFYDANGYKLFFERYNCPRWTTPDEKGQVILDYAIFIK